MECVQCSTVVDNGNKTSELPNGAWVGWLDWTGGRAGAHAWEQSVRSAVLSGSHRTSRTPLHSDASFKTSFELDYSYVSFPKMKGLCTGPKTGGICYEHEVLWIGRRRLLGLRTERIILLADHSIFAQSLLQTFLRPPPLTNWFFQGWKFFAQYFVCRTAQCIALSFFCTFHSILVFFIFYMNNIKSQKFKVFLICKRLFRVLQKSLK